MSDLSIRFASSIDSIDPEVWDQLSETQPFQSHRWYMFGQQVMADCPPVYLLVYEDHKLIGRACLWLVRNEPLPPKFPAPLRTLVSKLLKRWPLLICRSPMANTTGLIVPQDARRGAVLSLLTDAALTAGRERGASMVLFDFLNETEVQGWPSDFVTTKMPNSGTVMENHWQTMEEYLADGNKKDRQHYKRSLREAEKRGLQLARSRSVSDLGVAISLIRNVERRHMSPPNPWMRSLLEHMEMVDGMWLEAYIGSRLVGCGLILEDQGAQMTTALGLRENEPYAYFLLVYASLEHAFERQVRLLRWGTGAYEVKQRLGFALERDNYLTLGGTNRLSNWICRLAA
jgi:predicted N-acyltransferase